MSSANGFNATRPSVARIVIIGASLGGLRAAETLRDEGFDGELVMIGDEADPPYDRPRPRSVSMYAVGRLSCPTASVWSSIAC